MQAQKKIDAPFHKTKKDFCNLIDIAISHFNLPFAAIDIFEKGRKIRIASSNLAETNTGKEFYSSLNFIKSRYRFLIFYQMHYLFMILFGRRY